ncbi:hypothetical protein AVEN_231991-1 [Araneus ventricosus]|uniref:Uncharacterized protein n=1 Tax=Araneus ventricosus TaxID=182803 RepID=A0A4Y2C3F0_ARAVE|nr:hypothetical protein AVEN_231991-1 [Araneus ventricosus]
MLFNDEGSDGMVAKSRLRGRGMWKLERQLPAHLSSSSTDEDSEMRGPSQNKSRFESKLDVYCIQMTQNGIAVSRR